MSNASYLLARGAYRRSRLWAALARGRNRRWDGVRILGYHRLADPVEPLSVAPEEFRAQMELVRASGATPIRLDRALELLSTPVSGRYVCVTFDDGYRDNIELGEPILRELEIPATIFLPTAMVDGRASYSWYDEPPPALSWDEVRDVARAGLIDFQSHTVSHPWLTDVTADEALRELRESKEEIERRVGSSVTSVAFPAGRYGPRDLELVREAGYQAGVSTDRGLNRGGEEPWALRRTLVYSYDSRSDFQAKLLGIDDGPSPARRLLDRLGMPYRPSDATV